MSDSVDYDVVIVGGGMVGSMLAAVLATQSNLKVAVLERQHPEAFPPQSNPPYDIRVSALSIATQRLFERVGAWQGVLDRRACIYRQMLVWDGEESGQTHFRADDISADALGHIVENRVVQLALLDRITELENVDVLCPMHLASYTQQSNCLNLSLCTDTSSAESDQAGTQNVSTRLLIGADGALSSVRELAGINMERHPYEHHALVATIETELEQQDITWQRFLPTGPQAFLPLCGSHASMVWYHNAEEVARLKALPDEDFMVEMQACFPNRLGNIKAILNRASFPIVKAHASSYISERMALVGDAAHTVHPLAGQGVNLGMLDAACLGELLVDAATAGKDIGSRRLLRRYERWRRGDNAMMISILDGFYHAFKPQPEAVRRLRSAAMSVADNAGPMKHFVMRYAMGTAGDLPRFVR